MCVFVPVTYDTRIIVLVDVFKKNNQGYIIKIIIINCFKKVNYSQ